MRKHPQNTNNVDARRFDLMNANEGRAEGADLKNRQLAKDFRDDGFSLEAIAKRTGLTKEEILAL